MLPHLLFPESPESPQTVTSDGGWGSLVSGPVKPASALLLVDTAQGALREREGEKIRRGMSALSLLLPFLLQPPPPSETSPEQKGLPLHLPPLKKKGRWTILSVLLPSIQAFILFQNVNVSHLFWQNHENKDFIFAHVLRPKLTSLQCGNHFFWFLLDSLHCGCEILNMDGYFLIPFFILLKCFAILKSIQLREKCISMHLEFKDTLCIGQQLFYIFRFSKKKSVFLGSDSKCILNGLILNYKAKNKQVKNNDFCKVSEEFPLCHLLVILLLTNKRMITPLITMQLWINVKKVPFLNILSTLLLFVYLCYNCFQAK